MKAGTFAIGATTLSAAQMPSHNHSFNVGGGVCGGSLLSDTRNWNSATGSVTTSSAGSSGSHTHGLTGAPGLSGTISGTNGAITLNVQYIDIILCSKN